MLFQACTKTCYQQQVISLCHCADPYVEKYGAAFDYTNVSSCAVQNETQGISLHFIYHHNHNWLEYQ